MEKSQNLLVLFSHLTDEVINIPNNLIEFHDEVIINTQEEIFNLDLFEAFLHSVKIVRLETSQCVEMRTPLFLNGEFSTENMKLQNTVIEWDLNSQLLKQLRLVQDDTQIDAVTVIR
ncbi:hypothetical protein ACO0K3_15225 [Undibacterium sp. Rencai35W]|uniref:hypothetical protein n=1 Tax=Undibacterium sp. Rencai35W TaxID=3413046 RepID=UPI003BEF7CF1